MTSFGWTAFAASLFSFSARFVLPIAVGLVTSSGRSMWKDMPWTREEARPEKDLMWVGRCFVRGVLFACDAFAMWVALALLCGAVVYLGAVHLMPTSVGFEMYDSIYVSFQVALIPLIGIISARPLGIFEPHSEISDERASFPDTFKTLLLGEQDEKTMTTFSARCAMLVSGALYFYQVSDTKPSNYRERFVLCLAGGGVSLVVLAAFVSSVVVKIADMSLRDAINLYSTLGNFAFTVVITFLGYRMTDVHGQWNDVVSGYSSFRTEFLYTCPFVAAGVPILTLIVAAFVRHRRGYSGSGSYSRQSSSFA